MPTGLLPKTNRTSVIVSVSFASTPVSSLASTSMVLSTESSSTVAVSPLAFGAPSFTHVTVIVAVVVFGSVTVPSFTW